MKSTLKVNIPNPCHENWNKMSSTQKGKFCQVCTKEVIDFTKYSDEQLIKYFNKKSNLCGRFINTQLNRKLVLKRRKNKLINSSIVAGVLSLLLFNTQQSKAQEKPKTTQTDKKFISIALKNTKAMDSITVSGSIIDESNLPLPGATVIVKGSSNGTSTDFNGNFSLSCYKGDVLIVSYVGYNNLETTVSDTNLNLQLQLDYDEDLVIMGIVATQTLKKRWIGGNLFTRFTNIFRKEKKNPRFKPSNH